MARRERGRGGGVRERPMGGVFGPRRPRYLPRQIRMERLRRRPGYLPRRQGAPGRGAARSSGGGMGWLIGLLVLVGIGVLIWYLVTRDGGQEPETGATNGSGTLLTQDGTDLLVAAGGDEDLSVFEDSTVEGTDMEVQTSVSEVAFWVGGDDARILVVANEEAVGSLEAGDEVDLAGIVRVLPVDYEERFGITDEEGATDLEAEGHYVEALRVEVAAS